MNKKTKKNMIKGYNKLMKALSKDIISYGGVLFFTGRLIYNAFILYYLMKFVRAFLMFSFKANGVVDESHLKLINVLLYAIGVIYLFNRMGVWRDYDEPRTKDR